MIRTINDEIRQLQKTQALLICVHYAADDGVDFDVADALAVIATLIDESITRLDQLAVSL